MFFKVLLAIRYERKMRDPQVLYSNNRERKRESYAVWKEPLKIARILNQNYLRIIIIIITYKE